MQDDLDSRCPLNACLKTNTPVYRAAATSDAMLELLLQHNIDLDYEDDYVSFGEDSLLSLPMCLICILDGTVALPSCCCSLTALT